ncbi:TPA: D-glycerate dehydrogenase [Candidatus Poribacteria bacterium]|nr:D-glycerate dehydrogenase [Candidatus Poribacteria bacterium]HEX29262.1 D-glycerate dehydrogenase [Candidatus Poribacteria bacterium]
MRRKVYVTRRLPQPAIDMLEERFDVEIYPEDRAIPREVLMEKVKGIDALLPLLTDKVDAEVMDAAGENLKIIANYAVGYDNIDVDAATKRKIAVTNTPGVLTETTADMAWALMFAVARRVVEADKFTRAGKFKGWGPMMFLGGDVYGKTLGVVGVGRIGSAVAKRAKGFNMRVLYTDVVRNEEIEKEVGAKKVELDELLRESDFVTLHVPLMPSTRHLIGERELKLMKKTAYLINTSRGPVVDERALVEALRKGEIAGAGLDVYENEPELSPGLAELDNVVLTPHIASASVETRTRMATLAAENIIAFFEGKRPPTIVNPEVLG